MEQLLGIPEFPWPCTYRARGGYLAGCSKSSLSKAAGESKPEAYPQGYVEDFDEPRTKLADFFSILLRFGFAVIQMPVLPVEPGMAKFVGKNVAPSS